MNYRARETEVRTLEAEVAAGAACTGADPGLFTDPARVSSRTAARYCARCPVRLSCFALALELRNAEGIWGGVRFGTLGPMTEPVLDHA